MISEKDTAIAKLQIAEEDNGVAFLENRLRAHASELFVHNSAVSIRIKQKLDEINDVLRRH